MTPHLVPVLLEQLTKQEEGQDQDESTWNLAMSAGTCLGLIARVAANDVVPVVRLRTNGGQGKLPKSGFVLVAAPPCTHSALLAPCLNTCSSAEAGLPSCFKPQVMPFVTANIAKSGSPEDWRWREAATFAFGSIMEGPSPVGLVQLVQQAMPFLMQVRRWVCRSERWCVPV